MTDAKYAKEVMYFHMVRNIRPQKLNASTVPLKLNETFYIHLSFMIMKVK